MVNLEDIPLPPRMGKEPKRDYMGRYILPDPSTGSEEAWTRVSTLKSKSSDKAGLEKWKMRLTLTGIAAEALEAQDNGRDPLLVEKLINLAADEGSMPDREYNKQLQAVADHAFDLGGGNRAAKMGTALHAWCEWVDRGLGEAGDVPKMFQPYVVAYQAALLEANILVCPELIEQVVINQAYGVAGTFDRAYMLSDESIVLADIKSGKDVKFGWQEIAQQMAAYQTSEFMFDQEKGEWVEPPPFRTDYALIIHVPVMAPVPKVHIIPISLAKGRTYLTVSKQVSELQRDRDMGSFQIPSTSTALVAQINAVQSREELVTLWEQNTKDWTTSHTLLGKRRLATISKQH